MHKGTIRAAACAIFGALAAISGSVQAQDKSRSITVVLSEEPISLDGCNSTVSANSRIVHNNVGEGLTQFDNETGGIVPSLALSWKRLDDLTWQFKLREGVRFHDGAPFNAETAARSINRSIASPLDCGVRQLYFRNVAVTATAVDPATVNLVTKVPEPILPTYMAWVMLVSPNTPMDQLTQTTIGTGPYKFESFQPGQDVVLARNPDWWGPKPQVESVRYVWRTESSVRAAMIKVGEADLTEDISSQDVDRTSTTFRDISYTNMETAYLRIDTEVAPLNDKRLRIALNLAVDRESMRGSIFTKEVIPATNLVAPSIAGYNPNLKPWPYDPAKAKQLVAEAKADGVPVDRQIDIWGRINLYQNSTESVETLLAMWNAVGFNMKMTMMEAGQWLELFRRPHAADRGPSILQTRHNNQSGDAVFTAFSRWACGGGLSAMCDPDLDKKIDAASQLSGEERVKAWQEVFRIAYEDTVADVVQYHLVGYARVGARIDYAPTFNTLNAIEIASITFR